MITASDNLMNPHILARSLHLSADWLEEEARSGRLPHVNAGGRILFNREAVVEALSRRAAHEGLRTENGVSR